MNLLTDWIPEQVLYAIGWTLVHSVWQLFAVGIVLWIGLKLNSQKSAGLKYNLGLVALGSNFLLTLATFVYEFSSFAPSPDLEFLSNTFVMEKPSATSAVLLTEVFLLSSIRWIDQQLPLLVNFWIFGSLLFLFRLSNSLSELRSLRYAPSLSPGNDVEKIFERMVCKLGLDSRVKLKITQTGHSPITFGHFKPVVLIPAALIFHLSPLQLEAIIAHELAHVKRNDYLVNLIQSFFEVLYFYHPSYWWMSQTIKELRENAADDLAVQSGISPKELAFSLAEVLNFANQASPELALPASERRNPTLQRIKRILGQPAQNYPQNPTISITMLLTLLFSAGLIASAQQDSPEAIESIDPLVYLENPEIIVAMENNWVRPVVDTVSKKSSAPRAEGDQSGPMVWTTDSGEKIYIRSNGSNSFTYRMSGDTVITDGDTIILKGNKNIIFRNGDGIDWSTMPKMDFDFPEAPVPPGFGEAPMPNFEMGEMPQMPSMPPMAAMPPMPEMDGFEFFRSGFHPHSKAGAAVMGFTYRDTTEMSKAEKEKWAQEVEKYANEWAKRSEELMKEWEPQMKAWEQKMEAWHKANEPKMKEFEEKMKAWEKANEPKMKEFEEKMKAWEEANEPKMREFEKEMEEWQKKFQPKMEEFQRKMEIWQKENAAKMEEFQRKLQEEMKKKDNEKSPSGNKLKP